MHRQFSHGSALGWNKPSILFTMNSHIAYVEFDVKYEKDPLAIPEIKTEPQEIKNEINLEVYDYEHIDVKQEIDPLQLDNAVSEKTDQENQFDYELKRKRELANARVKKHRKRKQREAEQLNSMKQDEPNDEIKKRQIQERNLQLQREMARERSRRYRERKRLHAAKSVDHKMGQENLFDDEWKRKKELVNARMKKHRKRKQSEAKQLNSRTQDEPNDEIKKRQIQERNVQRKREMARERSRRYRERKRLVAPKSVDHGTKENFLKLSEDFRENLQDKERNVEDVSHKPFENYGTNLEEENCEIHVCDHIEESDSCSVCNNKPNILIQSDKQNYTICKITLKKCFICEICNKSFAQQSLLTAHYQSQVDGKPYTCDICSKLFCRKNKFFEHVRIHTRFDHTYAEIDVHHKHAQTFEKRFNCHFCSQSFIHRNGLIDHLNSHTGERPYKCDICSKSYTSQVYLRAHKRTHGSEKGFICNNCGKSFLDRRYAFVHMRTLSCGSLNSKICSKQRLQ